MNGIDSGGEGIELVAFVCSDAEAVLFVHEKVDEFEAIETAGNGAVLFADFFPGFDGEQKVAVFAEVEADHGVGHERGTGEWFEDEFGSLEVLELVLACFPVGFVGAVFVPSEVAHVGDGEVVSFEGDLRESRQLLPPVSVVAGFEAGAPEYGEQAEGNTNSECPADLVAVCDETDQSECDHEAGNEGTDGKYGDE